MNQEKDFIDQFIRRVSYGNNIKKIDYFGSHSGNPFYFYCIHCGIPTEAFPEQPLKAPLTCCSQCNFLIEINILEKAKELSNIFFSKIGDN